MVLGLEDVKDVFPLFWSGVNTSWVVSAYVQKNDTVVLGILQVFNKTVIVESFGLSVVVTVVLPFSANNFDESSVKWPGRIGNKEINIFVGIPVSEELHTETEGTSTRNTLGGSDSSFLYLFAIGTISKSQTFRNIRVDTLDSSVLVVHVKIEDLLFSAANTLKNQWLVLVVSVDTHSEELFLGISLLFEGFVKTKDGIRRGSSNTGPGAELSLTES